jgi:hypothetical protein
MATIEKLRSDMCQMIGGGNVPVQHHPVKASQTFKTHDFVQLDSNGQVADPPVAAGNDWATGGTQKIAGRALIPAPATTNDPVPLIVPGANIIFIANYNGTLDRNLVGTTRDLRVDGGGFPVVSNATSNAKLLVVGLIDQHGDVNGRVGFTVLDSAIAVPRR